MKQVYTFGSYLRSRFGLKVHKVPVSISGFTCPNIDGTVAKGGCTFCENDSFSPSLDRAKTLKGFYLNPLSDSNPYLAKQLIQLEQQFNVLSQKLKHDYGAERFIVYFQSFTNTYAPLDTLMALYERALSLEHVVGISIGTRSDCVDEKILSYLSSLSRDKEIWIEYGIQSVFDETLERINRGHNSANIQEWITKSKAYNLNVCGHLIFGLPGENSHMMLQTAKAAYEWGIDSVKYHPLYVVKHTALANSYLRGEFNPISETEYLDVLCEAIVMKPLHVSVQRLTAGIDNDTLLAPSWCRNRDEQIRAINAKLKNVGLKY